MHKRDRTLCAPRLIAVIVSTATLTAASCADLFAPTPCQGQPVNCSL
jgi:hypothetical protein